MPSTIKVNSHGKWNSVESGCRVAVVAYPPSSGKQKTYAPDIVAAGSSAWRSYDVSRDGKTFIFVKPSVRGTTVEPIVVLNWAEEVKRLMAAAGIK